MPLKNKIARRIRGKKKTPEELQRLAEIRAAAKRDFPPRVPSRRVPRG